MSSEYRTIQACWNAINERIVRGRLPGNGTDKTAERNGLIFATNILSAMMHNSEDEFDADPMTKAEIIRRREEGHFLHLASTGQLLRMALIRAGHRQITAA